MAMNIAKYIGYFFCEIL